MTFEEVVVEHSEVDFIAGRRERDTVDDRIHVGVDRWEQLLCCDTLDGGRREGSEHGGQCRFDDSKYSFHPTLLSTKVLPRTHVC